MYNFEIPDAFDITKLALSKAPIPSAKDLKEKEKEKEPEWDDYEDVEEEPWDPDNFDDSEVKQLPKTKAELAREKEI